MKIKLSVITEPQTACLKNYFDHTMYDHVVFYNNKLVLLCDLHRCITKQKQKNGILWH